MVFILPSNLALQESETAFEAATLSIELPIIRLKKLSTRPEFGSGLREFLEGLPFGFLLTVYLHSVGLFLCAYAIPLQTLHTPPANQVRQKQTQLGY
ncbi:hypothetical protein VNO77_05283 [Canavalia gladiata]|uniref:Uncharacterized protein n=1 Tax=Canavalia gladiata TaxID=3824 RepID=A0AAN9R8I4_CANGL